MKSITQFTFIFFFISKPFLSDTARSDWETFNSNYIAQYRKAFIQSNITIYVRAYSLHVDICVSKRDKLA